MKLQDSITKFNNGVRKVVSPNETIERILLKLYSMKEPILKEYQRLKSQNKIFLYSCEGTNYYEKIVKRPASYGKGHTDKLALASALMEMIERYSCYKYLQNKRNQKIISFQELGSNTFKLNDIFLNITNKNYTKGIRKKELFNCKFGFRRAWTLEGNPAYLPLNFISHSLELTNGMTAGNSFEEALLHGIYEVIERHCIYSILSQKINVPTIELNNINSPIIKDIIHASNLFHQRFIFKDFSLGIGIPVVGLIRKISRKYCIITAGVASSSEEALIRALAENIQIEHIPNSFLKKHKVEYLFLDNNKTAFHNLPNIENRNLKLELQNVNSLLKKKRMRIFYCNTTDDELNIPCAMVYVSRTMLPHKQYFDSNLLSGIIYEYYRLKDRKGAKHFIDKAKRRNKPQWLLYTGLIYMRRKKYERAIDCFVKIFHEDAAEKYIKYSLFYCGLSYLALNNKRKFIEILNGLLKYYEFCYEDFKYAELKTEFIEIVGDIDLIAYANILFKKLYLEYIF